jgi:two-component system chemotaxis response regulator CheB
MTSPFKLAALGVSAGGLKALDKILPDLPASLPLSIVVVQHRPPDVDNSLEALLNRSCRLPVTAAGDKELMRTGHIYCAPPDYHLLIEEDGTFSLNMDEKVNFARPSIDVLFESAAQAYGPAVIGIILTGANSDGAAGLKLIKEYGGLTVVQDPAGAEMPAMPQAAVRACAVDYILPLSQITALLRRPQWPQTRPKS